MPEEFDLDDLIDILPDDEIDALLKDLDLGDFEENADMIQHGDNKRVDPAKSRDAKERYRKNRETYRKAFDKFRRSSRGKLFYKKLSRFNQRPSTIMKKDTDKVESLIDKVIAGNSPASVILSEGPEFGWVNKLSASDFKNVDKAKSWWRSLSMNDWKTLQNKYFGSIIPNNGVYNKSGDYLIYMWKKEGEPII